ncbi:MAG: hypothetical protein QXS20_00655 [Candidatus Thorarchaeota archaeon]
MPLRTSIKDPLTYNRTSKFKNATVLLERESSAVRLPISPDPECPSGHVTRTVSGLGSTFSINCSEAGEYSGLVAVILSAS